MKKEKFVCSECGYETGKWLGRCPSCGSWNTFKEMKEERKTWIVMEERESEVFSLEEVKGEETKRSKTGIEEVDRVFGGGIPKGSLILIGGEPGIGKSTLLLQIAGALARRGEKVLYVSAEESLEQLKIRARRLNLSLSNILALSEASIRKILNKSLEVSPDFLIIDSIQTIYHPELPSIPGTPHQVRECGAELLRFSKKTGVTTIIVGHVTKDGTLAGPRTLEHMVDVILYLEGERNIGLRLLRATKSRFGSTEEIGIFEMGEEGLIQVKNPSLLFISDERKSRVGVAVVPVMEGQRTILVEFQALVSPSSFPVAQRNCTGFDMRRLSMIVAVLEKKLGLLYKNMDIFLNVTGGIRVEERAADLGVAIALYSSHRKAPIDGEVVFIGEIGLTGEIRPVKGIKKRLSEAKRLGFRKGVVPVTREKDYELDGMEIIRIREIGEAIDLCVG